MSLPNDAVLIVCPGCGNILTRLAICPDCEAVKSKEYKKLFDDITILIKEFQEIKKKAAKAQAIRVKKNKTRVKKKR